jgi:hypothetical protein
LELIKKGLWPVALALTLVLFMGAAQISTPKADASIVNVWGVAFPDDEFFDTDCDLAEGAFDIDEGEVVQAAVDEWAVFCIDLSADTEEVTLDADGYGEWVTALCGNEDNDTQFFEFDDFDDECSNLTGQGTDQLHIFCVTLPDDSDCAEGDTGDIIAIFLCEEDPGVTDITFTHESDEFEFVLMCKGEAASLEVSVTPATVEVVPARGNTAHSLVRAIIKDSSGGPVSPFTEVDFTVSRCAIEEGAVDSNQEAADATRASSNTYIGPGAGGNNSSGAANTAPRDLPGSWVNWHNFANASAPDSTPLVDTFTPSGSSTIEGVLEADTDSTKDGIPDQSEALAIFHADLGGFGHSGTCAPGTVTVTVSVEVEGGTDLVATATITVIGPPASITVSASPTAVRCGEKSTITATVKDSIGQNVSEHTFVEAITNAGGVLGGTGAVANFAAPVTPISSTVSETFSGVSTFFLLTSEQHSGPYEVVVTSGGTGGIGDILQTDIGLGLGGTWSTPPISAQATVTCTIPAAVAAPTITAPRTGTGASITPPNTGDAGLASGNGSSLALFIAAGAVSFALAGLATVKFARR